jgi:hypothetical protein
MNAGGDDISPTKEINGNFPSLDAGFGRQGEE